MPKHPSFGPVPPEDFKALVDAPCGHALKKLRKYDPLIGRAPGEKIEWEVTFEREQFGGATVRAASLEEAQQLAKKLTGKDIEWDDYDAGEPSIDSIEALP